MNPVLRDDQTNSAPDQPNADRKLQGLIVSNMWPQPEAPAFGIFVAQQVEDLRNAGHEFDLFLVEGWKSRWNYLRDIWRLRQHLRKHDYDLVHAHYVLSGLVALLAGAKPLIITHHGIEVFEGWQAPLSRLVTRLADRSLVISPAMAAHLGLPPAQVLPCGIDLDRFQPGTIDDARRALGLTLDPSIKRVVWVGADRPEKRLELAKQSIDRLNEQLELHSREAIDADGAIDKSGSLGSDQTMASAETIGSGKSSGSDSGEQTPSNSQMRVELHQVSGIPPSEVPIHIQACDALLVTSTREGGPLVVKEALATGRPVVSTDVGDVAALLAGLPGCSIQDDHPSALAKGLADAITLGPIDASERIASFDRKRIAARLLEHYVELVGSAPNSRQRKEELGA